MRNLVLALLICLSGCVVSWTPPAKPELEYPGKASYEEHQAKEEAKRQEVIKAIDDMNKQMKMW